jgi:hypothetical protein
MLKVMLGITLASLKHIATPVIVIHQHRVLLKYRLIDAAWAIAVVIMVTKGLDLVVTVPMPQSKIAAIGDKERQSKLELPVVVMGGMLV